MASERNCTSSGSRDAELAKGSPLLTIGTAMTVMQMWQRDEQQRRSVFKNALHIVYGLMEEYKKLRQGYGSAFLTDRTEAAATKHRITELIQQMDKGYNIASKWHDPSEVQELGKLRKQLRNLSEPGHWIDVSFFHRAASEDALGNKVIASALAPMRCRCGRGRANCARNRNPDPRLTKIVRAYCYRLILRTQMKKLIGTAAWYVRKGFDLPPR